MSQKLTEFLEILNDTNKTVIMFFLLALGAIFRVKGFINGQEMVDLWKTTTVSFFSTTAAIHIGSVIKDHLSNKLQEIKNNNDSKGNDP